MKKKSGFTLIELLIFIVVIGILTSFLAVLYVTMLRNSPTINSQTNASQIASRCMDWHLGQRFINDFNSSSLACGSTTPSFCIAPTGYSITTNIACTTLYGDSNNYKTITVTAAGTSENTQTSKATLSTIIANY